MRNFLLSMGVNPVKQPKKMFPAVIHKAPTQDNITPQSLRRRDWMRVFIIILVLALSLAFMPSYGFV
jgi:hypothetical protein